MGATREPVRGPAAWTTAWRRPARGLTLVELAIVMLLLALMATWAWPALQAPRLRAGRMDGTAALHRVHAAQEVYRAQNGQYAGRLNLLRAAGSASSEGGLYAIELRDVAPGHFVATATARGVQARDRDCAVLTLRVEGGLVHHEPSRECWLM